MKAGFARACITPPLGTRMMGVGDRDLAHGCDAIHDDVYVRAAYFEHEGEAALIMSFDLCFIGREDADRFKGLIGRHLDLLPRQILMAATHSHVSPSVGTWYAAEYLPYDRQYLRILESATLDAARRAHDTAQDATLWTGISRSALPMNRRRVEGNGVTQNAPNPGGLVCDVLPVCLVRGADEQPLALLYSIATHPSLVRGFEISGEYPGIANDLLDRHLGTTAALFLQGTGGDSKPTTIADGDGWKWDAGWPEMEETGTILANETIAAGLTPVEPHIRSALFDTTWPLQTPVGREEFQAIASDEAENEIKRKWAARQLERLDRGEALPAAAPVLFQGIQLGHGLRLIAIEGEPMAAHGHAILEAYPEGVTFPLGYANGEALYLVTSNMLDEGGMEPESFWEYGHPAPLAPGTEGIVVEALKEMRRRGVG